MFYMYMVMLCTHRKSHDYDLLECIHIIYNNFYIDDAFYWSVSEEVIFVQRIPMV